MKNLKTVTQELTIKEKQMLNNLLNKHLNLVRSFNSKYYGEELEIINSLLNKIK